ncbi:Uu.00g054470.m01.CDS01 [Anthostomella pinea]|uniref:Uu.00g054470.m01.CDS01 n=1 Tax=Anthostomella pinea TaxID=933095 RepID=A0AAI8VWM8_9PEZI|nr:Uu.00g054470.m01.CDS01 [Anthostomella pinea]
MPTTSSTPASDGDTVSCCKFQNAEPDTDPSQCSCPRNIEEKKARGRRLADRIGEAFDSYFNLVDEK